MKLGELVSGKSGGAFSAPTRTVKFKVVGKNLQGVQVVADAVAELAFVPEDQRTESRVEAEKSIRQKFADGNIPPDLLHDEKVYHLLLKALRDSDDQRQPFASTISELKQSLTRRTVADLFISYEEFCAEEFPSSVDDDIFEEMVEEAEKKSLAALLTSHGSSKMLRALPSLVAHFGKSQTETSGAGAPG